MRAKSVWGSCPNWRRWQLVVVLDAGVGILDGVAAVGGEEFHSRLAVNLACFVRCWALPIFGLDPFGCFVDFLLLFGFFLFFYFFKNVR